MCRQAHGEIKRQVSVHAVNYVVRYILFTLAFTEWIRDMIPPAQYLCVI